jgi:dTDP-4-amino-4,6-dideoxygalactose transaminase
MTRVPLLDLAAQYQTLRPEIQKAVDEVLESQQFVLGPAVDRLEREVAAYCQVQHAVGVASGSDALLVVLMALRIGPGDEVITTPYTFFATASAIARVGAKIVFVDVDPATYNINPDAIERAITPRTRAIIPVHLFGQCAEMDPILKIGKALGLPVIEDAAQAIGATYKGRKAGSMGIAGCLSFFPSKNLGGGGDGGMVLVQDAGLADRVRMLRGHGALKTYEHLEIGINSRLDSLQAAILSVKLPYLDGWSEKRAANAKAYDAPLSSVGTPPTILPHNRSIYNQYVLRVPQRDALLADLKSAGIGCAVYYPIPLHLQPCFQYLGYRVGDFPEAERAAQETIALPIYPELTAIQKQAVIDRTVQFYKSSRG